MTGPDLEGEGQAAEPSVRLDVWLNVSCLFKTRSQAKTACGRGRILVNGTPAKPHRLLKIDDRIEFRQGDWHCVFVVKGLCDRSIPKAEARLLYEDLSPPRRKLDLLDRILKGRPAHREPGKGRPTKRERRRIDRLKG